MRVGGWNRIRAGLGAAGVALAGLALPALAQNAAVEPTFSIWSVKLGHPVSEAPDRGAAIIACGTDGGPMSIELKSFSDWAQCSPEPSGLREVAFTYDDEEDYIARALEVEYRAFAGGTSIYAHPVVVSILVDDKGIAQGIRVVSDDRAKEQDRRTAVTLGKNLQGQFSTWGLNCQDLPPVDGEQPVGKLFIHWRCTGTNPDGSGQKVLIEASYLRKKGQEGISRDTQQVNKGYYQSQARLELVNPPYSPSEAP